jgi:hypothetical protein
VPRDPAATSQRCSPAAVPHDGRELTLWGMAAGTCRRGVMYISQIFDSSIYFSKIKGKIYKKILLYPPLPTACRRRRISRRTTSFKRSSAASHRTLPSSSLPRSFAGASGASSC